MKEITLTDRVSITIKPPAFEISLHRWDLQLRALRFIRREGPKFTSELHLDLWTDDVPFSDRSHAVHALLRAKLLRISLWDARLVLTRRGRRLLAGIEDDKRMTVKAPGDSA